jgi:hypothetical protein
MTYDRSYPILEQVSLPGGDKAVLYDMPPDRAHVVGNLACEAADGTLRWSASPGTLGPDAFVAVRTDGELLLANTWSGYALWLDPGSGEEVRREFTK